MLGLLMEQDWQLESFMLAWPVHGLMDSSYDSDIFLHPAIIHSFMLATPTGDEHSQWLIWNQNLDFYRCSYGVSISEEINNLVGFSLIVDLCCKTWGGPDRAMCSSSHRPVVYHTQGLDDTGYGQPAIFTTVIEEAQRSAFEREVIIITFLGFLKPYQWKKNGTFICPPHS